MGGVRERGIQVKKATLRTFDNMIAKSRKYIHLILLILFFFSKSLSANFIKSTHGVHIYRILILMWRNALQQKPH